MMDTYHGHVRTPADAIKLFEACRLGLLPRVQRRLSEKERQSIKSGSVFVWDEREAGMRRWTDGKSWSASRVSGSFLTYREMEGKRGGGQFVPPPARRVPGKTPDSGRGSDEDDLDGEGPDGYRYKPDGLMKQSFSITTSNGQHLHLISYYSRPHSTAQDLPTPTTDPQLRHIVPVKGMYPESTVHEAQGPAVTRSPMQQGPYMQTPHHPMHAQRHPYPYQAPPPGYGWPPSPASTPPFHGYPAPMYAAVPPPPHHSPYGQPHPGVLTHAQVSAYDRPPPPLGDSSLPPPPPQLTHPRGMSTATAAQQGLVPVYAPNPSPRIAQARLIAEQAQIAQRALQSTMIDPRIASPPTQLPPVQLNNPAATLPPVQINEPPRAATPPQQNGATSQAGTPKSPGRVSPKEAAKTNGATSIPSISHLVHATDSSCVVEDNKNNSRPRSQSPKGEQAPKDIPHDKLNIDREGRRAISVLDRKFHL